MLNVVLSVQNFREHSLFHEFMEQVGNDMLHYDPSEYELYEEFLTYLEDL